MRARAAIAAIALPLSVVACTWDGPSAGVRVVPPAETSPAPKVPAAGPDGGATAGSSVPTVAPLAVAVGRSPATPSVDVPDVVAVVGDSLTLSAQEEIASALTELGVGTAWVDGRENRRMVRGDVQPGIDAVVDIQGGLEPDLWVIALGTNDVGAQSTTEVIAADMGEILAAIPDGVPVVWVDVWIRDRDAEAVAANTTIRDVLAGRDGTVVADWHAHGADDGVITGDGIHLTARGQERFASLISASVAVLSER